MFTQNRKHKTQSAVTSPKHILDSIHQSTDRHTLTGLKQGTEDPYCTVFTNEEFLSIRNSFYRYIDTIPVDLKKRWFDYEGGKPDETTIPRPIVRRTERERQK